MSDPLKRLIKYDRVARELAAVRTLLAGVPDDMRSLHDEHAAASAGLAGLEAIELEAQRRRMAAETAIAEAQEKLRKYQAQVSQVRNQREYAALLTEIDGAKTAIRRSEEETLTALEAAEKATADLTERRADFAGIEDRYRAGLAEWEQRKPEVARRAADLEATASELRGGLPKPILAQYERIAERYRGSALSALRRAEMPGTGGVWFCSTCNFQVRPQVAVEIRVRGTIVQCEGCRRFLYEADAG
ncbi:MAG: hypothetical protein AMXMBFR36_07780 [Acidobacteriota bacterium]